MLDIHDRAGLEQLLEQLRRIRSDHQWVEAKAARRELPKTLWQSVSAFANSDHGGVVLLGVNEGEHGTFDVVGVDSPAKIGATLAALCSELDPPLRPPVHHIEIDGKVVVTAVIPSLPRSQRPCHKAGDVYAGSYIRVGDRDDQMKRQEVDELLQGRESTDHSARLAPRGTKLDAQSQAVLVAAIKAQRPGQRAVSDRQLLVNKGAVDTQGRPTLAGFLAAGDSPESKLAAARVTYRELPHNAAGGKRFEQATHAEGTVGQILDHLLALLSNALKAGVTQRGGHVRDALDVPRLVLREVIGNALIHRSLVPGQEGTSATVEVDARRVLVTNPGGVPATVNLRDLGTTPLSTPRNLSLARVCELLTTPAGERITEGQASGILESDRECHREGTAPALFASKPALFSAMLLRGRLPVDRVRAEHGELTDDQARLLALATVLAEVRDEDAAGEFSQAYLDEALTTRALANSRGNPGGVLAQLEARQLVQSRQLPDRRVWDFGPGSGAPAPSGPETGSAKGRRDRLSQLVEILRATPGGQMRQGEIREALGLSKAPAARIIREALDARLIAATSDKPHDPTRAYRLTQTGLSQTPI